MANWLITTGILGDDPVDDICELGDEHQEGVRSQLPGKLQQSTSLARRCQVQIVV